MLPQTMFGMSNKFANEQFRGNPLEAQVYQRPISHRMKSIGLLAKGIKRVVPSVGKNV